MPSRRSTRIVVDIVIDASPDDIWDELAAIERHVEWMTDAASIEFHDEQRRGVGTTFTCLTKLGPVSLDDEMEVTRWDEREAMGVRHSGVVSGEGTFELQPVNARSTRVMWREELSFPWWMAGSLGGVVGGRVLALVWRRNLKNLRDIVERHG
ncbi:MAG: SRPBCC family protein [Acidimicrobiia bacterium]|nr:SRPBCC family protein [Acidimicrobiia bacterium]